MSYGPTMSHIILLPHKAVWLIHEAIQQRIASEEARYLVEDSQEDADGDYGNDLNFLKILDEMFAKQRARETRDTAQVYQCWFDPKDNCVSLTPISNVQAERDRGALSDAATLHYEIIAETFEEAMAIHHLRQGWAPYVPMGEVALCPKCAAPYYPLGSGDCWRCGKIVDPGIERANPHPEWVTCGKSISKLIQELKTFEDQELEVRLSLDSGVSHKPVSILSRRDGYCVLENCER